MKYPPDNPGRFKVGADPAREKGTQRPGGPLPPHERRAVLPALPGQGVDGSGAAEESGRMGVLPQPGAAALRGGARVLSTPRVRDLLAHYTGRAPALQPQVDGLVPRELPGEARSPCPGGSEGGDRCLDRHYRRGTHLHHLTGRDLCKRARPREAPPREGPPQGPSILPVATSHSPAA